MAGKNKDMNRKQLLEEFPKAMRRFGIESILWNQALADRLGINLTDLTCLNLLGQEGAMTAGKLAESMTLTTGAIMLISAQCLEKCGLWDESFFLYSEETEFALRARDHGFATRLAPEARATHLGGESNTSARLWALLSVNRVRLYRRRHSAVATALYWCAVMLREAPRAALGRRTSRAAVTALLRLRPVTAP